MCRNSEPDYDEKLAVGFHLLDEDFGSQDDEQCVFENSRFDDAY